MGLAPSPPSYQPDKYLKIIYQEEKKKHNLIRVTFLQQYRALKGEKQDELLKTNSKKFNFCIDCLYKDLSAWSIRVAVTWHTPRYKKSGYKSPKGEKEVFMTLSTDLTSMLPLKNRLLPHSQIQHPHSVPNPIYWLQKILSRSNPTHETGKNTASFLNLTEGNTPVNMFNTQVQYAPDPV